MSSLLVTLERGYMKQCTYLSKPSSDKHETPALFPLQLFPGAAVTCHKVLAYKANPTLRKLTAESSSIGEHAMPNLLKLRGDNRILRTQD